MFILKNGNSGRSRTTVEKHLLRKENQAYVIINKTKTIEKNANEKYPVNVSGAGDTVLAMISVLYDEDYISISDLLFVCNLVGELVVENELTYVLRQYDLVDALFKQWTNTDSISKIVDISLVQDIVTAWIQKRKSNCIY